MSCRDHVLAGLDLRNSLGIEVGPLASPLVTRAEGRIIYVDHIDTAGLRAKYAGRPGIDVENIVEVDAVWGDKTLREAVGEGVTADYLLASHLIEHVPDLLGWLEEARSVLRPGGKLRLVVPDRRFTFDYLRRESRLSDALHASLVKARVPQLPALLDHILEAVTLDARQAWQASPDPESLPRIHDLGLAQRIGQDVLENGTYHDVHCWVFTPASFAGLMERASGLGLVRFSCERFFDTAPDEVDFTVAMEVSDDPAAAAASWRRMREACADLPPRAAATVAAPTPAEREAEHEALARAREERAEQRVRAELAPQLAALQQEKAAVLAELAAMRASRLWRLLSPWRRLRGQHHDTIPAAASAQPGALAKGERLGSSTAPQAHGG
ncbi:methyltransferase domain-containing protein [Teichococcus aerofrigidensis]